MKIKLLVACEIQYFELGIFSFNSYFYYLPHGFIAWTRAFNLLTRAFNLATRASSLLTRGFELITRGFELVTRNSRFTFLLKFSLATKNFGAILATLIILIRKRLNRPKISSLLENNLLTFAITFCFCLFSGSCFQLFCYYDIFYEVLLNVWQKFHLACFLFIFFFWSS